MRHAFSLTMLTLKLVVRDRRAFLFSLVFPLGFLFIFGMVARGESPALVKALTAQLVTLTILTGSFFGQGMGLVVRRERGMLRRYRLTPLSEGSLVAGTAIAGLVLLALTVALQLILWNTGFGAPMDFAWPAFVAAAVIGALAMASLGMVVAAFSSTVQEAQILFQVTFLGSLFLSGIAVPTEYMPGWMRVTSLFVPPTYVVSTLTHAIAGRFHPERDGIALVALLLMTIAAFTIAARLFRWDKDDPLPRRARLSALLALLPVLLFGLWRLIQLGWLPL